MSDHYDVIIIGGGVMGCASAYYLLKKHTGLKVLILEMDSSYEKASTPLSDGNTRIQFNIKENIQMSQYGLEVLSSFAQDMEVNGDKPDIAFRRQGNLFILDEASRDEAYQGMMLQQSLGCKVAWLIPEEVRKHYPLYNLKDCVAATFGSDDGTMSPLAVLMGYRKKAVSLGAGFKQSNALQILRQSNQVTGVQLATGETLHTEVVVNATGAWAAEMARTAHVDLPILPTKRQVTVIKTYAQPQGILPGLFLPSGMYLFHEREGIFTVGKSFADDYVGTDDFNWNRKKFEEDIWPELADYIPEFEQLKIMRGWAGLYEVNSLDGNAILGEWPELRGFYLANGFSGHGFQHCHAVGRYIAELILAETPALDLSVFSPQRILDKKPVFESKRKII